MLVRLLDESAVAGSRIKAAPLRGSCGGPRLQDTSINRSAAMTRFSAPTGIPQLPAGNVAELTALEYGHGGYADAQRHQHHPSGPATATTGTQGLFISEIPGLPGR